MATRLTLAAYLCLSYIAYEAVEILTGSPIAA